MTNFFMVEDESMDEDFDIDKHGNYYDGEDYIFRSFGKKIFMGKTERKDLIVSRKIDFYAKYYVSFLFLKESDITRIGREIRLICFDDKRLFCQKSSNKMSDDFSKCEEYDFVHTSSAQQIEYIKEEIESEKLQCVLSHCKFSFYGFAEKLTNFFYKLDKENKEIDRIYLQFFRSFFSVALTTELAQNIFISFEEAFRFPKKNIFNREELLSYVDQRMKEKDFNIQFIPECFNLEENYLINEVPKEISWEWKGLGFEDYSILLVLKPLFHELAQDTCYVNLINNLIKFVNIMVQTKEYGNITILKNFIMWLAKKSYIYFIEKDSIYEGFHIFENFLTAINTVSEFLANFLNEDRPSTIFCESYFSGFFYRILKQFPCSKLFVNEKNIYDDSLNIFL